MYPFKKWMKHVLYYDFHYFLNKTLFKKVKGFNNQVIQIGKYSCIKE